MTQIDVVQAASPTAPFVTIGAVASLSAERALTGTSNQIIVTDNGANSTAVLSTPQDIHTGATPTFARLGLGLTPAVGNILHISSDAVSNLFYDVYVGSISSSPLALRKARGSLSAPRRVNTNDELGKITLLGAQAADDVTDATFNSAGSVRLAGFAMENFTSSARGSKLTIDTVDLGTATRNARFVLDSTEMRYHGVQRTTDFAVGLYAQNFNNATYGTDYNQFALELTGQVDKSGTPSYKGDASLWLSLFNESATPALKQIAEIGIEGAYDNSSVLDSTTVHWFMWDFVNSRTLMDWAPFGLNSTSAGNAPLVVKDVGLVVKSVSGDYGTASGSAGSLTVNETTTASYWGVRVKPTLNTGGSNTNKTVYLADLDSTNTSVTGVTVVPLRIGYGGTELARLTATGQLGLGITAPTQVLHVVAQVGANTSANFDQYSANATGPSIRGRKFRGSLAAPRRANTDDVLFAVNNAGGLAADDSTDATAGGDVGQFRFRAAENFTSSAQGSYFELRVTPIGSLAASAITAFRVNGTGNVKIAGSALRGTTEGTNHLDIFDGTAPAGTLTNGVSLYSASGELRAMDAAGNSSLLSPHDRVTNEWIFDSVNTVSGRSLRIDMERLMRALDAQLGGGFIHEGLRI